MKLQAKVFKVTRLRSGSFKVTALLLDDGRPVDVVVFCSENPPAVDSTVNLSLTFKFNEYGFTVARIFAED